MTLITIILWALNTGVLFAILIKGNRAMSHFGAQYDDLLNAFRTNTDAVAARLDKLVADVAASKASGDPLTDAQFDAFKALSDHLKALGTDERLPVPALAPEVVAAPVEAPAPVAAEETAPALVPLRSSKAPKADK